MKPRKVTSVRLIGSDDNWDCLYINGKAVYQNHGMSIRDFMLNLQDAGLAKDIDFKTGYLTEEGNKKCEDLGQMPENLSEVDANISEKE